MNLFFTLILSGLVGLFWEDDLESATDQYYYKHNKLHFPFILTLNSLVYLVGFFWEDDLESAPYQYGYKGNFKYLNHDDWNVIQNQYTVRSHNDNIGT